MPPDRGPVTKTSKPGVKKESKSTPRKENKAGDASSVRSSRLSQDGKFARDTSLSRRGIKTKKEENTLVVSRGRVSTKSRIDAEKLNDVKTDMSRDLSKMRETLARNRTVKNSPQRPTATRAPTLSRTTLEGSASNTSSLATRSVGNKKVLQTQPISKKTSLTKTKTSDTRTVGNIPSSQTDKRAYKAGRIDKEKDKMHTLTDKPKKLSRERTRTRTLSPHEVKIATGISLHEFQSTRKSLEQPALSSSPVHPTPASSSSAISIDSRLWNDEQDASTSGVDNYEDDFEEYESDFEEDVPETTGSSSSVDEMETDNESVDGSSDSANEVAELSNRPVVEEEKKMDSGNYDLAESKRKNRELQQIKEALQKENAKISSVDIKTRSSGSVTRHQSIAHDEGFEEEKLDEPKSSRDVKKAVFINFASAKKKMEEQKVNAKSRKRGEELLNMIKLDTVNFFLLDLPPVPYEVYMRSYGRSNTQQASVQTNEDNLSEEIQTDEIFIENKWTQYPVSYHSITINDHTTSPFMYSQDHLGVGGDSEQDPGLWKKLIKYDAVKLNGFLLSAGQAILQFLEQQSFTREKKLSPNSLTSFFSPGVFKLSLNFVPFLAERPVSLLCFSDIQPSTMLSVHPQIQDTSSVEESLLGRCMICVWNILKPSAPEKILVCSENASSACFHSHADNLLFGGLCDGAICIWDLREPAAAHRLAHSEFDNWVIRSPTYSTAEVLKTEGHFMRIIGIQAVKDYNEDAEVMKNDLSPIQVCSVDLTGVAIVWTVIQSKGTGLKTGLAEQDLGLAHWGKVRLVRSISFNIFEGLDLDSNFLPNVVCQDMCIDSTDGSHFYVCTNSGHVVHCLTSGCKPHPKVYFSLKDIPSPATCIESTCMVGLHYMLVGFEGGIIKLYSRSSRKPLATYSGTGDVLEQGPAVKDIQLLAAHPGHFFVLDKTSQIHLWNLTESDILPIKTFAFEEQILSMKLSNNKGGMPNFLAIATVNGDIQLHQLKPEFCYKSPNVFEEELKKFRAYTKAL